MELTKALNYMKIIIDNAKKRKNSTINVRNGLKEYLAALIEEGVITETDLNILVGVIDRVDAIMKSKMSVDEAFVRSMCAAQNEKYIQVEYKKDTIGSTNQVPLKNKEKDSLSKPLSTKESYSSNPWDSFPIEPDGSCGRFQNVRKKEAYMEWKKRLFEKEDNGVWSKCRH